MTNRARSCSVPAMIGMVFGGLWAVIGAMALPPAWRLPMILIAGLITVVLVVAHWRADAVSPGQEPSLFGKKAYRIAVMLEVAAIFLASALLPGLGWQDYFLQVVGIIVGLHFIGLWFATRSARFLGIAAGMCVVSAVAIPLPGVLHLVHVRNAFTGAGNALILWSGASQFPFRKTPTPR